MNAILKSSVGSISATSVLAFLSVILLVQDIGAQEFKQFNVNYKLAGKNMSNTIYIPRVNRGTQANVRGVMQNVGGPLKDFAHRNQVALIARLDQGRGFSKELLAAAAEASGRPEVEFAGAIVQGISKGGRAAADWADANQKRAIAVFKPDVLLLDFFMPPFNGAQVLAKVIQATEQGSISRPKQIIGISSEAQANALLEQGGADNSVIKFDLHTLSIWN